MSFLSDANEKILNRFWNFSFFCNFKIFVVLYVIQQNAILMWYHNHKRYVLQNLNVSVHHWVIASTSWCQQPFYWNYNTIARGSEVTDWSANEEELAGQCLLQEVWLDRCLRQLGHWIQYPRLHLHLNALRWLEADNWVSNISRNDCVTFLQKKGTFFHCQWIIEGWYNFSS